MNSRSENVISLSGRSYGTEKKKGRTDAGVREPSLYSPSSSSMRVRVKVPVSTSNLQRHDALSQTVQLKRNRRVLSNVFYSWNTARTIEKYIRGKVEVLYEECFYKWLNTRRRQRSTRKMRRAHCHYLLSASRRVFSALTRVCSQRERWQQGFEARRRSARLTSYYHHALKKKVFRSWKSSIRRGRVNNTLQMEHQERRSKIQVFLNSLQKPSGNTRAHGSSSKGARARSELAHRSEAEKEHEREAEYCPRSQPPPRPTALRSNVAADKRQDGDEEDSCAYYDEEGREYEDNESEQSGPPSFASLSSASHSPRSSITTSPLRSPRRRAQYSESVARHGGFRVINENHGRSDCEPKSSSDRSTFEDKGGLNTLPPPPSTHTSSAYSTRSSGSQRSRRQEQRAEETSKQRRERLRALQRETAERISKKKANDEAVKRQQEVEEERQLARHRQEHINKLAALKSKPRGPGAMIGRSGVGDDAERRLLSRRAASFRARQLLIRWGIAPWVLLVRERRLDWLKACTFYSDGLVQAVWAAWAGRSRALRRAQFLQERRQTGMAASLYRHTLLRGAWRCFARLRRALAAKARAVHSHCVLHGTRRRAFGAWRVSLERRRREVTRQLARHGSRSRRSVLEGCWRQWRAYLQEVEVEKEIDSRVDVTWLRVQEWLT